MEQQQQGHDGMSIQAEDKYPCFQQRGFPLN